MKALIIIAGVLCLRLLSGCGRPDGRVDENRMRVLDSLRELDAADSIERASLDRMLNYRLTALEMAPLESSGTDAIRLTVEFSWGGPREVGPWLSIAATDNGQGYNIMAKGYPNQSRQEMVNRELKENDFNRLMNFLDSIDFEQVSHFEHVDYTSTDPDRYFIERVKGGKYHAVCRSSFVDLFVYKLFVNASVMAGMPGSLIERLRDDEQRAKGKMQLN